MNDEKLRKELKKAILSDREFITDIAKEIFSVSMTEIGGNYPGTVADFFRKDWR